MTDHEQVADVLDGAADHIEKYGHHKGSGFAGPGSDSAACVIGAITIAGRTGADMLAAEVAVRATLDEPAIARWNDAPERTEQEVLDVLRLAAKQERRAADGAA